MNKPAIAPTVRVNVLRQRKSLVKSNRNTRPPKNERMQFGPRGQAGWMLLIVWNGGRSQNNDPALVTRDGECAQPDNLKTPTRRCACPGGARHRAAFVCCGGESIQSNPRTWEFGRIKSTRRRRRWHHRLIYVSRVEKPTRFLFRDRKPAKRESKIAPLGLGLRPKGNGGLPLVFIVWVEGQAGSSGSEGGLPREQRGVANLEVHVSTTVRCGRIPIPALIGKLVSS